MDIAFLDWEFLGNPLSAYLLFVLTIAGTSLAARIVRFIVLHQLAKWAEKTETKWDDVIISAVSGPSIWLVAVGGAFVGKEFLLLTDRAEIWVNRALMVAAVSVFFVAFYRLFRGGSEIVAEEYLNRTTKGMTEEERAAEAKTVARIRRQINEVAGMVVILLGLLTALSNMGVDLKAIWASLGVGGIALALAVKDPLANVMGRMYIYSTGLFDVGHPIQIDSWNGTVTRIGVFRTSLELSNDMSTVSIPNAEFISKPLKNFFGRKKFVFKWDLDVPYEVSADALETLVERLRALVLAKPEALPETVFVYVERFDKSAKVVRVWFQVRLQDFPASTLYGTRVLGEVQRLFSEMGIGFAYPKYVVHIEGQTDKR